MRGNTGGRLRCARRTGTQERQFVSASAERGLGLRSQRVRIGVWALVVADVSSFTRPKAALVRDHGVMPGRQTGAEFHGFRGSNSRAQ
jgi:hypothetical protein